MSAGAIATGDDLLTLLAILTGVLLWLRTNTSGRVPGEILGVVGLLVSGYIIVRASGDLMFLAMICTPILLFLILENLRKVKAMEWGSLHQFVFLCLLLIVVVAAKIHQKGVGIKFPFSPPNNSWSQVQYWAAQNTPRGAVFIVPPNTKGFRNFSKRTIVGDNKDGGANSYSESYAKEWSRRMKQLQSYQNFTDAEFMELAKEYKASFLVVRCGQTLSFQKVYRNSDFCVYEIPG